MDQTLLHDISYGMYIIGTKDADRLAGCVVNTVAQITSENPTVAVSINKNNYTYEIIKKSGRFSINILSEKTRPEIIGTFGFQTSKDTDKYADCSYELIDNLPVIKEACCGSLLCEVAGITDMETHVVVFARVLDLIRSDKLIPMTYSYYHRVIKGKAPKNAPTYQEETISDSGKIRYVCSVCGYVHEGEISEEPDDYVCPICHVSKDEFVLER